MGEYSLRSLARHVEALSQVGAQLGPARATLLRDTLRHALTGEGFSRERLRVVLQPLDEAGGASTPGASAAVDPSSEALASLEALLEAHRALLPALLSAAQRGDSRLLGLSRQELLSLLDLWIEAARVAGAQDAQAFARLFAQLAGAEALEGVTILASPLRRLFLGGNLEAAEAALDGLFRTSGIRPEDRRFFRRLDLHLTLGTLPEETLARLGTWVLSQETLRHEIIDRGARGSLRVRLRAARHLCAAALGAEGLSFERREEVATHLKRLLADPVTRVGQIAAWGAAAMTPHPNFEDLWEPWFAGEAPPGWLPRVAAGLGPLHARDPERARELLSALLAGGRVRDSGQGQSSWLCGLASALSGLARSAPDWVEPVLEHLAAQGDAASLATAARELAGLRQRDGTLPVEETWTRRLDHAMGAPAGRSAEDWALVLAGREALVAARGGRPTTSLTLLARALARRCSRGAAPGSSDRFCRGADGRGGSAHPGSVQPSPRGGCRGPRGRHPRPG